ncbi:hypothetical protein [uncultured Brevundimonas sp.]|uniref:hypothetical protein n=1 Tax=uncultured Brevundimonas sp. TaxID=213418 RepID=UPI0025E75728|nr:hypothetical protein [uncultured Brevundimonas sp.]
MWRGTREPASAVRSLSGRWRPNGGACKIRREVEIRDAQIDNPFAKDLQIQGLPNARRYLGDRLARVAKPHKLLDPKAGR